MTIKEMRTLAGMTQKEFAEYFNIPRRTIENWEEGERMPPVYVPALIEYKLQREGFIKTTSDAFLIKIIETNALMLNVPMPGLKISPAKFFKTPTTRAALIGNEDLSDVELHVNRDYLRTFETDEPQAWLSISHEMRHFWQIVNGSTLSDYETSDQTDIETYNAQDLELDAWAWASYVLQNVFGLYPTFDFLGDGYTEKVLDRAKEIGKTKKPLAR